MSTRPRSRLAALRRGFLINMANPKAAIFFGSLFITVLPAGAPAGTQVATVAIVGCVAATWFTSLALMFSIGRVRAVYGRIRRPAGALIGITLIGLGAKLAVNR